MFISNAYAEAAAAAPDSGLMNFLPLIALVAVFYFLILRPQSKRAKEQKAMISALQRGDEVVTVGGEVGSQGQLVVRRKHRPRKPLRGDDQRSQ